MGSRGPRLSCTWSPFWPWSPLTLSGNSERGKEEVWEASASFPLLFLSPWFFPPSSRSLHSHALPLCFFSSSVSFSLLSHSFIFILDCQLCCLPLPAHFVVVVPPLPVPPCLRSFDQACISLLQNSVSLPFPVSCPPAPLLPVPLLLKWQRSMIRWPSPGGAPGRECLVPPRRVV